MAVCRFHAAGFCKFGAFCRNKHDIAGETYHEADNEISHNARPKLTLPPIKDNLSRDYRFIVPSPTVESDKIFYSSDSDWDERGIDDVLGEISSLAIVSCSSCGYMELKQQPCSKDISLCLKCKGDTNNDNIERGDFKDLETKKRRKKRKKKPVVTQSNLTELFEGTPEGVKVYKMKEESREDIEQPLETVLKDKNKVLKSKKLTKESSKSKLSVSPSPKKIYTVSTEKPLATIETVKKPYLHQQMLTSICLCFVTICQFLQSLTMMLVNIPHTIKIHIYEIYRDSAVEEVMDKAYRYISGNRGTKYSRRRKIIK